MNEIKELIKAINSNIFKNPSYSPKEEYAPTSDFKYGYNQACRMIIRHLKVLQSKYGPVVVPEFVVEYLEMRKERYSIGGLGAAISTALDGGYLEVSNWMNSNVEAFARAWLDGYTVAKEPLYYVPVPHLDNVYYTQDDGGDLDVTYGIGSEFTSAEVEQLFPGLELDEPQLFHLNFLKERFEYHKEGQEYPFSFALEDWLKGEEGADLEDIEFTIIINAFTVWALEQLKLKED